MLLRRFVHQLKAGNAQPLKCIGRRARLVSAAAQKARARGLHAFGNGKNLLAVLNRAGACHHSDVLSADLHAIGKLHHRSLRAKGAAGQLVGRRDAMHIEHARKQFKLRQVDAGGGANAGQNGLRRARGAVHIHSGFHHGVDDGIDLLFSGSLLHGYNHCLFPISGASDLVSAPVPWPGAASPPRPRPVVGDPDVSAWAFLCDANSSRCKARITSMMRS